MDTDSRAANDFINNLNETMALLELFCTDTNDLSKRILLKSAVVVSVAYWERYIEDLVLEGSQFIADGLRNPTDLPERIKQKTVLSVVKENRESNPCAFSKSVWDFSGEGWAEQYKAYAADVVGSFNTASLSNVRGIFWNVLGIRDVFDGWEPPDRFAEMGLKRLDMFINRRHEIAHGSSTDTQVFNFDNVSSSIAFLSHLMLHIEKVVWKQVADIVQESAISWKLKSKYIHEIVSYFKSNGLKAVTNKTFQKISQSANSNYNKLAYEPWGLLEIESPSNIKPTETMAKFITGDIALPDEINVLKNQKAFPKSGAKYIYFQDLVDYYEH